MAENDKKLSSSPDLAWDYLSSHFSGLNYFNPEISSYTEFDVTNNPLSIVGNNIKRGLRPNIFKGVRNFTAIVLLPFKIPHSSIDNATSGSHSPASATGLQACKAICPSVHTAGQNPFAAANSFRRAEIISHYPTFVSETDMPMPLVPGSVIEVSFDNPYSYWGTGIIRKVIRGRGW